MNGPERDVAIRVRDLRKSFPLPSNADASLAQRLIHPVQTHRSEDRRVLDGLSFDVYRGEVFGIAGANGAGKSTLLRLIAGIYEPEGGEIEVAGRLATFIELGIGFQPDLTARQNVVINGVMMGLTRAKAESRIDEILVFAELEKFANVQLKNFSSGMRVRLAFAIMLEVDADIMILDEILAVGDAAFQERCFDAFQRLRDAGRCIVLVTHRGIERYCDRAMFLEGGKAAAIGDPKAVARHYKSALRDSRTGRTVEEAMPPFSQSKPARRMRASISRLAVAGRRAGDEPIPEGEKIAISLECELTFRVLGPAIELALSTDAGAPLYASTQPLLNDGPLERGRVALSGELTNHLAPGRYVLTCSLVHTSDAGRRVHVSPKEQVEFEVAGERDPTTWGPLEMDSRFAVESIRAPVQARS